MSTALVTGPNTHVGATLVRLLVAEGRPVRVFARAATDLRPLSGLPVEVVPGDFSHGPIDPRLLRGVATVFHTVTPAVEPWSLAYHFGEEGPDVVTPAREATTRLLEASLRAGVQKFIYLGSTTSLATSKEYRLHADDEWNWEARSSHVRAKLECEVVMRRFSRQHGLPVIGCLAGPTIGPGEPGLSGITGLIVWYLNHWWAPLIYTGFNVVDVRDVALGMLLAERKGRALERYILGGYNRTVHQLCHDIRMHLKMMAPFYAVPPVLTIWIAVAAQMYQEWRGIRHWFSVDGLMDFAGRHSFTIHDNARMELGYLPRPLRDTLQDTAAWLLARRLLWPPQSWLARRGVRRRRTDRLDARIWDALPESARLRRAPAQLGIPRDALTQPEPPGERGRLAGVADADARTGGHLVPGDRQAGSQL